MNLRTSQRIQLKKTISWTIISITRTTLVGWAITGNIYIGLGIGLVDRIISAGIYYAHERFWHSKYKAAKAAKRNGREI